MSSVQTKVSDRCRSMRRTPAGTYEYGWLVYNRRDRSQDYFNCAGEGSLEEAQDWMSLPIAGARTRVHKSLAIGG